MGGRGEVAPTNFVGWAAEARWMRKIASVARERRGGCEKSLLLRSGGEVDVQNRRWCATEARWTCKIVAGGQRRRGASSRWARGGFCLAAVPLTPCRIWLLLTRRGWAPLLDLRSKSHLPSGVRLRRYAPRLTPPLRVPLTGPQPHQRWQSPPRRRGGRLDKECAWTGRGAQRFSLGRVTGRSWRASPECLWGAA